jgi:TPR repeat protein
MKALPTTGGNARATHWLKSAAEKGNNCIEKLEFLKLWYREIIC